MGWPLRYTGAVIVVVVATMVLQVGVSVTGAVVAAQEEVEVVERCQVPWVIFGDSLVDVGENAVAEPLSDAAEFPPYGVDYFGRPAGRFSNGRVIADFLSQGVGYGLLDPYLNSVNPNFKHGVDFASSGSTAQNSTQSSSSSSSSSSAGSGIFSLDTQVRQYQLFKSKIRDLECRNKDLSRMKLPTTRRLSKGIHLIVIATNDYRNALTGNTSFDGLSLVTSVVFAIESALRGIHKEGARTMIVANAFPLGCAPSLLGYASTIPPVTFDNDSCVASYNALVDLHNTHLKQMIDSLRKELAWKNLVLFDLNSLYLDAIRHPSNYGVTKTLVACCGAGENVYNYNLSIPCGSSGIINGANVTAGRCIDPLQYISWDGLHPTESFAKNIARAILKGEYIYPSLSTIKDACKT